jgi:(p)ppGpp synthase/HD superfamily hydrolase
MDLQQLFLAMTEDARIIVVKLADRLHNMRTMASMPSHKQAKIAGETLRVFAPLAGLLGLWKIKTELEDLSLQCAPIVLAQHATPYVLCKRVSP